LVSQGICEESCLHLVKLQTWLTCKAANLVKLQSCKKATKFGQPAKVRLDSFLQVGCPLEQ